MRLFICFCFKKSQDLLYLYIQALERKDVTPHAQIERTITQRAINSTAFFSEEEVA